MWIAWIGGGIVVAVLHAYFTPFGQKHRLAITVIALPVEIPLFDEEKPLLRPVGQPGVSFQFLAQKVRVRIDPEHLDINRQPVGVADFILRSARENVDW